MIELYEVIISVLVLLLFFYGPYQWLIIESTRQRLFGLRQSVFITVAEDNPLLFKSDDYRELNQHINDMIRFAHTLSWWQVLLMSLMSTPSDPAPMWNASRFKAQHYIAFKIAVRSIVLRSLLLMFLFVIMSPVIAARMLFDGQVSFKWITAKLRTMVDRDIQVSATTVMHG